jgi:radical SAM superfamily enzyme YgiQ (UPF0313 family)
MKKILLIYPPFCTPASPPYSVTKLYSFLKGNLNLLDNTNIQDTTNNNLEIEVLDLNLEFHKLKFAKYQQYSHNIKDWDDYDKLTAKYHQLSAQTYSENNKKVINSERPEYFAELLKKIKDKKPDVVAFSIVYSSQVFYAYSLLKELKETTTIIGGPAINKKLSTVANKTLNNEIELLNFVLNRKIDHDQINFKTIPDFSIYNLKEYFTPYPVVPIRTSNTCYYQKCTFCSHFSKAKYYEFPLDIIKETIINSKQKHFFLIDDMIPAKRLLEIAKIIKPLNVKWTCQLKPTAHFSFEILKTLRESGLTMIIWGVESGSDRVLKLMQKGTNLKDIEIVIQNSHKAGIKNVVYIMFGFPTETKQEFLETMDFLQQNEEYIDLISTSIFGLQKGTIIYNHPEKYGITKIIEQKRTLLDSKISYELSSGLSREEVKLLVKKHKLLFEKINKYPRTMNYFREHMFCLS